MRNDEVFWKEYNEKLNSYVEKCLKFNDENEFNFIENSFYPHVRDLSALLISNLAHSNKGKTLRVLDYGSNILSIANLKNKISTKEIEYIIYDPFSSSRLDDSKLDYINYKSISNQKELESQSFDLIIFGSSIQYVSEVYNVLGRDYIEKSNHILFTHTPLSLVGEMTLKQHSSFEGDQKLYSFSELRDFFINKGYSLTFKSTLDPALAAVNQEFISKVVYANLLFSK